MKDGVIVASYLVIGLTEEDVHYIRKHLEQFAMMFIEDEDNVDVYSIEMVNDNVYPCIALRVDEDVWERFSRSHDNVECSMVMSQNNILGVLH